MRIRGLELVAALALVANASPARAVDAPHDQTFSTGDCSNCHALFDTTASGANDSSRSCVTCHQQLASPSMSLAWQAGGHQGMPGLTGNQHSWSAYADSPLHGAQSPGAVTIQNRLVDGKLQCAVCHDIHASSPSYAPAAKHSSIPLNSPVAAGGGSLTLTNTANAAAGWRVKIVAGSQFILSHTFGLATPTWLNWNGSAWVAGTDTGAGKSFLPVGSNVTLDDGVTTIKIAGAPAVGTTWDFYVSFPFLRASNVNDAFCYMCHGQRVMDHVRAGGRDPAYLPDGQRVFSHPVSVGMNANGRGYDRAQANVLDSDGSLQSAAGGDGRPQNDLKFDGTVVRCTTCHAAHSAASNSYTNAN